ncbi:sensor histidine kinase [Rhodococcoides corynebacterioides]|uniref:sensor histidine kinase n=1 Tax=Rhodococcoides corynebacterioides TaxID=53972 RepID=UPI001C9A6680|nr:sensor histidine kinase [Rhodococcus corynebacterioides]MBY6350865.1 sensor histidine kinase [Rhodococcus corynebacterioides]MBY6363195.1 sensor histidine kinase [Rhodococcus corynebacterioides]
MAFPNPSRMSPAVRRTFDIAVAVAVFAYNLPIQGTASPAALLVPIGLCLAYLLSRHRPVLAFVLVVAVAFVQPLVGLGLLVADVVVVLTLVRVAAARPWTVSIPAATVAAAWTLAVTVPTRHTDGLTPGDIGLFVAIVLVAWLVGALTRTRRLYVESLEERALQAERERETGTRIAVLDERARIARELHDVVSHGLSAIVLLSEGAASMADTDPDRARSAMLSVRDTGRHAMTEMRSMLSVLRSEDEATDPQPTLAGLEDLLNLSRTVGVPVTLRVEGTPRSLTAGTELVIYRVVQEALTNVRKHAGPVETVEVGMRWTGDGVAVSVTDDGRGGDTATGGLGVIGMRERVEAVGGSLTAEPADHGFVVHAWIPVPA